MFSPDYYVTIYSRKPEKPDKVKKVNGRISHQSKDGYKIYDNSVKHKFIRKITKSDIVLDKQTFLTSPNLEFCVVIKGRDDGVELTTEEKSGELFPLPTGEEQQKLSELEKTMSELLKKMDDAWMQEHAVC